MSEIHFHWRLYALQRGDVGQHFTSDWLFNQAVARRCRTGMRLQTNHWSFLLDERRGWHSKHFAGAPHPATPVNRGSFSSDPPTDWAEPQLTHFSSVTLGLATLFIAKHKPRTSLPLKLVGIGIISLHCASLTISFTNKWLQCQIMLRRQTPMNAQDPYFYCYFVVLENLALNWTARLTHVHLHKAFGAGLSCWRHLTLWGCHFPTEPLTASSNRDRTSMPVPLLSESRWNWIVAVFSTYTVLCWCQLETPQQQKFDCSLLFLGSTLRLCTHSRRSRRFCWFRCAWHCVHVWFNLHQMC